MAEQNLSEQIALLDSKVRVLNELTEISTVLNSTLQLDPLLEYIMDKAAEITDSAAASVLLWNQNTQELFFAATSSKDSVSQSLIGKPVPMNSIAGTILREKRIIVVDDAQQDPRHYDKLDEESKFVTSSLLGVPMTSKNRVIGVLEAINKRNLPWTDEDQHYLSILAAQAAVAIESAQLVRALRKANEELNQLDKLKSDFIAIASHELRTPLGVIMGYASFLQEDARDKAVSDHAEKVMGSALQLRSIIDSMLNLRYLKQSQSELHRETLALNMLLEELQHDILSLIGVSGHTLELHLAPENPQVYVDHARVNMGLANVLNNALRFTPNGGKVSIEAKVVNGREAWVTVSDNGIGLAQEHLEKIFEEFFQVEDHMTRRHGGLGIGLSITKAMIEAHGGRIWADSPGLNQGTTITFTLPLATG